jgi:hypothetical protein
VALLDNLQDFVRNECYCSLRQRAMVLHEGTEKLEQK